MGLTINSSPKSSKSTLCSSPNSSPSNSVGPKSKVKPVLCPVTIQWKGTANSVFISGSFFKWKVNIPFTKINEDTYEDLVPGQHSYKLLIDDKWTHIEDKPKMQETNGDIVNAITVEEKKDVNHIKTQLDLSSLLIPVKCPSFYSHKFNYESKMVLNENSTYAKLLQSTQHPYINHLLSVSKPKSSSVIEMKMRMKNTVITTASTIRVRDKVLTLCYYKSSLSSK